MCQHPFGRRVVAGLAGVVTALGAASWWAAAECDVCEAASSILLAGTVLGKCSITVAADGQATDVPITASGAQRLVIGTIQQNCTGNRSYTLTVASMNCASAPAGGKMVSDEAGEYLAYSTEFVNPTTGGSDPDVLRLLESSCTNQVGRAVSHAKINNETSILYLNFTGNPSLGAGTYQDVVTISLNMN